MARTPIWDGEQQEPQLRWNSKDKMLLWLPQDWSWGQRWGVASILQEMEANLLTWLDVHGGVLLSRNLDLERCDETAEA